MNLDYFKSMTLESLYDLYNQMSDDYPFDNTSIKAVPSNIVRDMVDMLPGKFWTNKDVKIMEFPLIDGSFLFYCCQKLMEGLRKEIPNRTKRLEHITCNCLYGATLRMKGSQIRLFKARTYLDIPDEHLYTMTEGGSKFYNSNNHREGVEGMPKFDLVVGNPPYNNDIYIDFVLQAQKLSKDKVVMITPAKWQGKPDDKNDNFRQVIVPYMSNVVYYPDTYEIFDILPQGGITYFVVNKFKPDKVTLVNSYKGNRQTLEVSDFKSNIFLNIDSLSIKDKILNHKDFRSIAQSDDFVPQKSYFYSGQPSSEAQKVRDTDGGYFIMNGRTSVSVSKSVFKHQAEVDNYKIYCSLLLSAKPTPCHLYRPNEVAGRASALLGFGSKGKCEGIKSYYQTKLISYLMYAFSSTGALNESVWNFIPDPQDWTVTYEDRPLPNYTPDENGIYTDSEGNKHCSLYTKYKLSPEEIEIIESVIKGRRD